MVFDNDLALINLHPIHLFPNFVAERKNKAKIQTFKFKTIKNSLTKNIH